MNLRNKVHGLREILHFENWPELVLKRTFLTANPLAVYRVGGMDILVDHSAGDSLYSDDGSGKPYDVQGVTLDDVYAASFAGETVDLMKLDVEGAEYDIVASPFHECLKQVRNLIIEIHRMPGRSQNEVTEALAATGFVESGRSDSNVFLFHNPAA